MPRLIRKPPMPIDTIMGRTLTRLLVAAAALLLLFSAPLRLEAQEPTGDLCIVVRGVRNLSGVLNITVADSKGSYLGRERPFALMKTKVTGFETRVVLAGIPRKDYAVYAFHDANGNGALDRNVRGLPKEPSGFSTPHARADQPPPYEKAKFRLDSKEKTVVIDLR
ncbi:MAG TPA: DUF2141 domain-containing protein [Deltaproteobacteria bacterium]|nr:DUF2141 domain-containing protein [Deltaproteobacteria bacterium]